MEKSIELYKAVMGYMASEKLLNQKIELFENIQEIEDEFMSCKTYSGDEKQREEFLKGIDMRIEKYGKKYINVIQNLPEVDIIFGTSWLASIVEKTRNNILDKLPLYL